MGAGYNAAFTQWSKGEYSNATNLEDDLAILANATNGFGYRTDDKGDTLATAPVLRLQDGSTTLVADGGVIEKNTDLDLMRFTAGAGTVSLQVRPAAISPNLYLKADLLDSAGTVLLSRTATKSGTTLTLSQSVAAGTYYLRVDGVGMPVAAGTSPPYAYDVSGYGSIGEYAVSGSIPVSSAPAVLSVAPLSISQTSPQGQNAGSQSFTVRNAGGGSLAYTVTESLSWLSVSPASGNSTGAEVAHTLTYATTGLAPGTYPGSITVTATGVSGSPQVIDLVLTVTPAGSGLTFSSAGAITFPSSGTTASASPYPSGISVSGVTQPIGSVSVELRNLQHSWASDLDLLLVAPNGQNVMLLSDAGGNLAVAGGSATLHFRDDAGTAPSTTALSTGTYRPTNYGDDDVLPSPAPPGPHGTTLSALVAGGVNGTWQLFAVDDFPSSDGGQILDGWSLTLIPSAGPAAPTGVSATDGSFTDRVRISWTASAGATGYEVFRSLIDSPGSAQSIGTTTATSFDDSTTSVGDTHFYWVKASNSGGTSAFSTSDAGFRGATATSNDAFSNRAPLSGGNVNVTASNTAAGKESGEPNHAGNTGGRSLWWSWTAPSAGTLTVDTVGSSFDTLLGVYTGTSVSALTTRGADDDSGGNLTSRTVVQVTAGTTYAIAVDGYGGASGTVNLTLAFSVLVTPPPVPPSISASDGAFTDRVRIEWTASAGATSYDVRRHTTTSFASSTLLGNTAAVTYDDTTAVAGTTYHYWVVARNSAGASSPAGPESGFRTAAISNDNFANRTLLTGNTASVTADNATATKEVGEPGHAGNAGGRSLWWRWVAPSAGTLVIDTIGSSFDTLLGVYTGTGVTSLTTRAADDDSGGNTTSRVTLAVTSGTEYQIAVDGFGGGSGNVKLQLNFQASTTPPAAPGGLSATDDTFTDRVRLTWNTAAGAATYDIYRHTGTDFSLASLVGNVATTSYDDLTAAPGTIYSYWVVSRNTAGASAPAGPESGRRAAAMPNHDFAHRTSLSGSSVSASGNSSGAGKESGEPNHAGDAGGQSLWWSWTAPSAGSLTIDTFGSDFDTLLAVYTGTSVSALTPIASNDDFNGATSRVSFPVAGGTTYQIAVDGFRGASGNVSLHLAFQPASSGSNDDFADRFPLNGEFLTVTAANASATREPGEPDHGGTSIGRSLWWTWTAPRDGVLLVDTYGSNFDTTLAVYLGDAIDQLTPLAENDDDEESGTFNSVVYLAVFEGEELAIAVDGYNGASGAITLNLAFTSSPLPPATLRARALPRGKIKVTWTPGVNTTSYLIERRDPGSARWRVAGRVSGGSQRFVQTRLRPRSYYSFRVRSVNAFGTSEPSPVAGARTRAR